MRRLLPALLATLGLLLAGTATAGADMSVKPKGPGTLFDSIDAAAVDGLAWAHKLQQADHNKRVSRGGTVMAVEGGYTYGPLVRAKASSPDALRLELRKRDVAHFHTYPSQGAMLDHQNEAHSKADRWVVDHGDSKQRPSYVLTPSLRVVAYHGRGEVENTDDLFVASLTKPLDTRRLAAK